jgi:hypothetical protein
MVTVAADALVSGGCEKKAGRTKLALPFSGSFGGVGEGYAAADSPALAAPPGNVAQDIIEPDSFPKAIRRVALLRSSPAERGRRWLLHHGDFSEFRFELACDFLHVSE